MQRPREVAAWSSGRQREGRADVVARGETLVASPGQLHDLEDRPRIGAPGGAGALDELRAGGEVGVGIHLDEVNLAVAPQTEVDTA